MSLSWSQSQAVTPLVYLAVAPNVDDVKEASELRQEELKSELETLRQGKTIQVESVK